MDKTRREELLKLMSTVNKKLDGKDKRIMFGTDVASVECVKTGLVDYDEIVGGEPRGRWTIDYGVEGCGKSTWNYAKIAALQAQDFVCAVIDAETGFDPDWCAEQGVNMAELIVIPAQLTFEDTINDIRKMVESGLIDFFLLDSIHGVAMQSEMFSKGQGNKPGKERSLQDDTVAVMARKVGQFLRTATSTLGKSRAMFTIIGQARESISMFNPGVQLTGGHALKHAASCIRQWTKTAKALWPRDKDKIIGFKARVKIEKTRLNGNEMQEIYIPFVFGRGPALISANVDAAVRKGIIEQGAVGSFTWKGKKFRGIANVHAHFEEIPEEYNELLEKLVGVSDESREE